MNKFRHDIEDKDQELAKKQQALKQAEQWKNTVAKQLVSIQQKTENIRSKALNLLKEKDGLEKSLLLREKEIEIMKLSATKDKAQLQEIISLKEKEIADLKTKLQEVREELGRETLSLNEQYQKVTLELASKSTEIKLLREAKEEMKLSLDIERKRYNNVVMQQTAANTSKDSYKQEVEVLYRQEWHDNILVVHVQFTIYMEHIHMPVYWIVMYNIDSLTSALMHKPTETASEYERRVGGEDEGK